MTDATIGRGLTFRYGDRVALRDVGFAVPTGTTYGVLGPNGSGKSTLFKLLATLLPVQEGELTALGVDMARTPAELRPRLGVVFQSPAVDRKLTVRQNLRCGGAMFGLGGRALDARIAELLGSTGLGERAGERVETLSGGLRRRVELAKCLLHRPSLLVLDEPTAGLDPAARREFWDLLGAVAGLTVLFTTHLLEEAERADRVLILHGGGVVAEGTPAELSRSVGGAALEVTAMPEALGEVRAQLQAQFDLQGTAVGDTLRVQVADAHRLVPAVVEALGPRARRVAVSAPSLLDVYFVKTGAAFVAPAKEAAEREPRRRRR
jgi:ABC-2 type transport system ATP-binding protein